LTSPIWKYMCVVKIRHIYGICDPVTLLSGPAHTETRVTMPLILAYRSFSLGI
jgi:hypothetical protein